MAVREKEKTRKGFIPNMKRPGRQSPPPPHAQSLSFYLSQDIGCACVGRMGEGAESASEHAELESRSTFWNCLGLTPDPGISQRKMAY